MGIKNILNKVINFSKLDYTLVKKSKFFNEIWYKKTYNVRGDGALHYCRVGYKLGYYPSKKFFRIRYELLYDEIRLLSLNPLAHFERYGKYESKFFNKEILSPEELDKIEKYKKLQNKYIGERFNSEIKNLIVFLVPDVDIVGGGVMSINSIAKVTKELKKIHHSDVILCTVPSDKTFFKYTKFDCNFNIYRFEQLKKYFKKLENVIIHIPEIYVYPFLYFLKPEEELWLKSIKNSKLNILNQNMDLMPRPRYVNDYLKDMFNEITITCAHKKYCVPQLRTSYDASVHFFSTSNLVNYKYIDYLKKEDLLLYSIDEHPMKQLILNRIKVNFPKMQMIEIKNMKYDEYLKKIGKAKWMITFGEGLDGYFVESLRSGTVAFSVYNPVFFDDHYINLDNIYSNYNQMYENIVDDIKFFDNKKKYSEIVKKCNDIDKVIYNDGEYKENIKKYYLCEYTFPFDEIEKKRKELLNRLPLVSIAVATYNGEKYIEEQIDSLLNLTYPNIEIIVSDDGSSDNTLSILKKYGDRIKLFKNNDKHGLLGNFVNSLKRCHGEYVALCDQDDIWLPDKIQKLLEHIDDFDIVHGGVQVINSNGVYHDNISMHSAYEIDKTKLYLFENLIKDNQLLGCTSLIRKSFLDKYISVPSDIIYHDWWFVLNSIKNGNGIVYIDNDVIKYRQHGENTAFKTFNNDLWLEKKLKFNRYICKSFNLSRREKDLIAIDSIYALLMEVFSKYLYDGVNIFLSNNYYGLSIDLLNVLEKKIQEFYNEF